MKNKSVKKIFLILRFQTLNILTFFNIRNRYLLNRKLIIGAALIALISVSCSSRRKKPTCYYISEDTSLTVQTDENNI